MSRDVPDVYFHILFFLMFSESKFYAIYNSENHIQVRGLAAQQHVFEYGDTTLSTVEKSYRK